MVTLLFVIVALGSFANSVEVRDNDNQLHKVSASLRRLLTGASGSSAGFKRGFAGEEEPFQEGMLPAGFRPTAADVNGEAFDRLDFVGEEGMLSAGFRPTAADVDPDTLDTFDRLDFVGEEGMLPAGFRPTADDVNADAFDRLDFVGEEGMLPAGFRPTNGLVFEEADDVNVDAFDDFGNRNAISHGWVGDDPEDIAAEDPNFFGFPGMHYAFPGMHDGLPGGLPGMHYDYILLRSDVECGNNENEVNLGTFADVAACAEACRNRVGCTNFIYGKGEKAGRCWDEAITASDCTIWEDDQYDFYGLPGTETVVNLPGF